MPLLKEEAEKLSNNTLEQGIIETIIDREDLFALLPFFKVNSKAYVYNREDKISEASFIDVNEAIPEGAATFTEHTAKLRILAGDVDVDKFLQTTMADTNNQRAIQIASKVKGIGRKFRKTLITGDASTNAKEFDGLPKLLSTSPGQNIQAGNTAMSFSMFDELVDAVKDLGADCIMMRSEHLRAYRALLRATHATPQEIMIPNFGRPMLSHNGVPFIINDFIEVNDADKTADVYCLHLSETNGLSGIYGGDKAGIVVEDIGTVQNKDAVRTRVKWYCGLVNKHDKAIARIQDLKF